MSADKIRILNDTFRLDPVRWGRLMLTRGVADLDDNEIVAKILEAVRTFNAFTKDSDPHKEHDFGAFEVGGHKLFWQISYYEKGTNYGAGAEAPDDETTTDRVMTIMLREEY